MDDPVDDHFDGTREIEDFTSTEDIDDLTINQIRNWMNHLERWDIDFCAPLDLDMLLLTNGVLPEGDGSKSISALVTRTLTSRLMGSKNGFCSDARCWSSCQRAVIARVTSRRLLRP
ncbi:MAG: hypothetical protein H0X12_09610 [Nocardioides sp.]|nr:hypothetical protein [Nocardioides sp.]